MGEDERRDSLSYRRGRSQDRELLSGYFLEVYMVVRWLYLRKVQM